MTNYILASSVQIGDRLAYNYAVNGQSKTNYCSVKSITKHKGAGGASIVFKLTNGEYVHSNLNGEVRIKL